MRDTGINEEEKIRENVHPMTLRRRKKEDAEEDTKTTKEASKDTLPEVQQIHYKPITRIQPIIKTGSTAPQDPGGGKEAQVTTRELRRRKK